MLAIILTATWALCVAVAMLVAPIVGDALGVDSLTGFGVALAAIPAVSGVAMWLIVRRV